MVVKIFFFFSRRRRHTRWPRDWSSDVCSSDLAARSSCGLHLWRKTPRQSPARPAAPSPLTASGWGRSTGGVGVFPRVHSLSLRGEVLDAGAGHQGGAPGSAARAPSPEGGTGPPPRKVTER